MLATLSISGIRTLTLGARDHAALLAGKADLCRQVLERDDWTCHACGSRVPEGMEIDHTAGHSGRCGAADLRAICPFCHDLRHPLWAASRGRIVPIIAPEVTQVDLHRLAWVLLAWRHAEPWSDPCARVRKSLAARHDLFRERTGCDSAEALFEAVLSEIRALGRERAMPGILALDAVIRLAPAEILRSDLTAVRDAGNAPPDSASRLSSWKLGGFHPVSDGIAEALQAWAGNPDPDTVAQGGA